MNEIVCICNSIKLLLNLVTSLVLVFRLLLMLVLVLLLVSVTSISIIRRVTVGESE